MIRRPSTKTAAVPYAAAFIILLLLLLLLLLLRCTIIFCFPRRVICKYLFLSYLIFQHIVVDQTDSIIIRKYIYAHK